MIPLPVILVEFLIAFGLALFGASALALFRLRREGNWPPAPGADGTRAPSASRIYAGLVVGFLVATWAVATFIGKGYEF